LSCAAVSPTAIHIDAYGVPVELRAYDAEVLAALRRVTPPGASITEPTTDPIIFSIVDHEGSYLLRVDDSRAAESAHLDEILAIR